MVQSPRVLGVVRLSVASDDSTSPEKQRGSVEHWAAGPSVNGRIVGWAEDLDISGGLDPFKRPKLGKWLTERADEFDVIAVWKLDRLTRRSAHFAQTYAWCQEHGKTIVSTTESIDMSTPMGKMFAAIIAAFAEGELDTIRARAESGALARLNKGVWVGGVLPCGYNFVRLDGGGKKLVQDSEYAPVVREILEKTGSGWSPYRIATDFNSREVPTWRDHLRLAQGEEPRGIRWVAGTVLAILRNVTLSGFYTYKSSLVEDDAGNPVTITDEPYMSYGDWESLVSSLGVKQETKALRATPSRSMLGGVAVCGHCGSKMSSQMKNKPHRSYAYYACNAVQSGTCSNAARLDREVLDSIVNRAVETLLGDREVMEKTVRDSGPRKELAAAQARLERLEAEELEGKYDGEVQREAYFRILGNLSRKIENLRAQVQSIEDAPRYWPTGKTYAQLWAEKDQEQRRAFLLSQGVKVEALKRPGGHRVLFRIEDVAEVSRDLGGVAEHGDSFIGLQAAYEVPRKKRGSDEFNITELPVEEIDWALIHEDDAS